MQFTAVVVWTIEAETRKQAAAVLASRAQPDEAGEAGIRERARVLTADRTLGDAIYGEVETWVDEARARSYKEPGANTGAA